jgi:hypothetical protein
MRTGISWIASQPQRRTKERQLDLANQPTWRHQNHLHPSSQICWANQITLAMKSGQNGPLVWQLKVRPPAWDQIIRNSLPLLHPATSNIPSLSPPFPSQPQSGEERYSRFFFDYYKENSVRYSDKSEDAIKYWYQYKNGLILRVPTYQFTIPTILYIL